MEQELRNRIQRTRTKTKNKIYGTGTKEQGTRAETKKHDLWNWN